MKTLYLECSSGISGDMIAGALLDLGADRGTLERALSGIKEDGVSVEIGRVIKNGIDCCDFDVILDEAHENHDHDMEYLFGHLNRDTGISGEEAHAHVHEHEHSREHNHKHGNEHDHGHSHDHDGHHHHEHPHAHRNLEDIRKIISSLDMTEGARSLAVRVFEILAEAEAKAHGKRTEEVHFHEVGAIDSVIDIVACAVCFDDLGITDVIVPKLCEGTGTVRCQHGILPVPVPAVLNVAVSYGLPLEITDRPGEYVTPTGAAFAAAVMTGRKLPERFIPTATGLGAGKRAYEGPCMLRAIIIEED